MTIAKYLLLLSTLFITVAVFSPDRLDAAEEVRYELVTKSDNLEVRQYPEFIVAETFVTGKFETVGKEGFKRLAAFINGSNTAASSISMTAPVGETAKSEKIPMTAPVGQTLTDGRWRITFAMPSNCTADTVPRPLDDRVTIKMEPQRLMAAIRYSGSWSWSRYRENEEKLTRWIAANNWKPAGEPVWARYNAPFVPWFLRRNEILIPIEAGAFNDDT